ncbi:unnamed protein product [Gongylonema pulchrum]|uniref:NADH-quinone oxidoreductase subunit H n=1 Tax=Gongylonema pulchrum TaxID=637853 RepID=A0A183EAK9_9BILA|nr:unnamed protein product [Gongylonema pulchrum]
MDAVDVLVLVGLLAAISFFGLYTALRGSKQATTTQVLHGSKSPRSKQAWEQKLFELLIAEQLQILLYVSVALYAPALALSTIISIPLSLSILLTAGLAALYVILVGSFS